MTAEEVLKDPGLTADIVEILGEAVWGGIRSERAKEATRRSFTPQAEAVVKMLRHRAGLSEGSE
jgi:hypothetical protein